MKKKPEKKNHAHASLQQRASSNSLVLEMLISSQIKDFCDKHLQPALAKVCQRYRARFTSANGTWFLELLKPNNLLVVRITSDFLRTLDAMPLAETPPSIDEDLPDCARLRAFAADPEVIDLLRALDECTVNGRATYGCYCSDCASAGVPLCR